MESVESKAVEVFIKSAIDQELVHKVIVRTLQIIPCDNTTVNAENKRLPSLSKFLNRLIVSLNLNNGILMSTIVYLNRLKAKLPSDCKGLPSTRHRILLSCLILSIKFNNDFSLKNYDWLKLTNKLFNLKDINLMERQLLFLLNWNLFINENELFNHFNKFLGPIKEKLLNSYRMKQYLSQQKGMHSPQKSVSSPQMASATSSSTSPRTPGRPSLSASPSTSSSFTSIRSKSSTPSPAAKRQMEIPSFNLPPIQTNMLDFSHRKPSTSSISSASTFSPSDSPVHYRHDSHSSVESLDSIPLEAIPVKVHNVVSPSHSTPAINPIIEMTALNEEYRLNKLLQSFQNSSI